MAKVSLIKLWTKEEHQKILGSFLNNNDAAIAYNNKFRKGDVVVSRQLVRYWRSIFMDNNGNKAKTNNALMQARKLIQPSPTDDIGDTFVPETCRRILVIGDLCDSNHGSLVYRRAKAHGLPVQFIKKYRDILFPEHGAPGWSWGDAWDLNTPLGTVRFQHQVSGDLLLNAAHERKSMVIGHFHGKLDIQYAASSTALYFGAHCGCLIDNKSLAFAYGRLSRSKPILGCMVITDGCPQIIPMLLDDTGRWCSRVQS